MPDIDKCCGTCRRWDSVEQKAPTSLRLISYGICRFNSASYKASEMKDCFGHKIAESNELERRKTAGLIENF